MSTPIFSTSFRQYAKKCVFLSHFPAFSLFHTLSVSRSFKYCHNHFHFSLFIAYDNLWVCYCCCYRQIVSFKIKLLIVSNTVSIKTYLIVIVFWLSHDLGEILVLLILVKYWSNLFRSRTINITFVLSQ